MNVKFQSNFRGIFYYFLCFFVLIIFQKDMQNVTMELRDKNGDTISKNETLYKEQSHLYVHILGIKDYHTGLHEVVLRRMNGEIVPSANFVEAGSSVGGNFCCPGFQGSGHSLEFQQAVHVFQRLSSF